MSDLIERLRDLSFHTGTLLGEEAADEIERLRARIEGAHRGVISNRRSSGVPDCIVIHGDLPSDSWGKKVLVVLEHSTEVSDVH